MLVQRVSNVFHVVVDISHMLGEVLYRLGYFGVVVAVVAMDTGLKPDTGKAKHASD